jgi:hypothetical protein
MIAAAPLDLEELGACAQPACSRRIASNSYPSPPIWKRRQIGVICGLHAVGRLHRYAKHCGQDYGFFFL